MQAVHWNVRKQKSLALKKMILIFTRKTLYVAGTGSTKGVGTGVIEVKRVT